MDFNFFESNIFCQIFNMNFNKIIWRFFFNFKKIFSKIFSKISKNILGLFPKSSHKSNQKVGGCGLCYLICTHWFPLSKEDTLVDFSKPQLV
jgi:hypothetical protein